MGKSSSSQGTPARPGSPFMAPANGSVSFINNAVNDVITQNNRARQRMAPQPAAGSSFMTQRQPIGPSYTSRRL